VPPLPTAPPELPFGVEHRPWPAPKAPWLMAQTWHDLLFAHWPLPPATLRDRLPAGLELDTYDGQAWLAVVPFRMSNIHRRGGPAAPWISAFPELNVRTYVRRDDRPGVLFFSLDAGNLLAVLAARRWYHLPYFHARMRLEADGEDLHYRSERTHGGAPPAELVGRYGPSGPVEPASGGSLAQFLTERYCLYAVDPRGGLYRGEVHHQSWPLQPAWADFERNTMAACHGLSLPDCPPLLHFARRLEVVVWPLTAVSAP
jgi:uncharacterized protein